MMVLIVIMALLAVTFASASAVSSGGTTAPSPSNAGTAPSGGDLNYDNISTTDLFGGLLSPFDNVLSFVGGTVSTLNGQYDSFIKTQAAQFGLNPVLVKAVIDRESSFRADAMSYIFNQSNLTKNNSFSSATVKNGIMSQGVAYLNNNGIDCSLGLMQVRATYSTSFGLDAQDLFDPEQNIFCGCSMIQSLIKEGASMPDNIDAYNMGIGNWKKGHRNTAYRDYILNKMNVYANDFS